MSGQIDVGWAAPPFGLDQLDQKQIRIIATGNDADAFKGQTVRLNIVNADYLKAHQDVVDRYMKAYRETVNFMYTDPAALKIYADWLKISEAKAKRTRDEFFPRCSSRAGQDCRPRYNREGRRRTEIHGDGADPTSAQRPDPDSAAIKRFRPERP
jgi:ABC-type nitrate/sulfonate/bicarbonate transport system substrate-binding protein